MERLTKKKVKIIGTGISCTISENTGMHLIFSEIHITLYSYLLEL